MIALQSYIAGLQAVHKVLEQSVASGTPLEDLGPNIGISGRDPHRQPPETPTWPPVSRQAQLGDESPQFGPKEAAGGLHQRRAIGAAQARIDKQGEDSPLLQDRSENPSASLMSPVTSELSPTPSVPAKGKRKKIVRRIEKPDKPGLEQDPPKEADGSSDPWQYGKPLLKDAEARE